MKLFGGIFFSLVLAGCASSPSGLPDPDRQIDPDPFQVKADKDIYGLRVDVYRNARGAVGTVNVSGGATPSATIFDAWDYALIGVDAGNGLFLDANGNLSVDLARLYGINPPFHIEERVGGLFPYTVSYLFQGSKFQRKGGGSNLPDQVATQKGTTFTVTTNALQGAIYTNANSVTYSPSGIHLTGRVVFKQVSPDRVEREGLLGNSTYILTDDSDADLTSKFSLQGNGKVIDITLSGAILGSGSTYRYVRTAEGCWFTDPQRDTHEISLADGTITVRRNGKVERTYKILPVN